MCNQSHPNKAHPRVLKTSTALCIQVDLSCLKVDLSAAECYMVTASARKGSSTHIVLQL